MNTSTAASGEMLATPAMLARWSGTGIVVKVLNGATTGKVVVTVVDEASNGVLFAVTSSTSS